MLRSRNGASVCALCVVCCVIAACASSALSDQVCNGAYYLSALPQNVSVSNTFGVAHWMDTSLPGPPSLLNVFTGAYNVSIQLKGGFDWCSNCGARGAYACSSFAGGASSAWPEHGLFAFEDVTPPDQVPLAIRVQTLGCYGEAPDQAPFTLNIGLNPNISRNINDMGTRIGSVQGSSNAAACSCGACDGTVSACSQFLHTGIPGYNQNGLNQVRIVCNQGVCLTNLTITIAYGPKLPTGVQFKPSKVFPGLAHVVITPTSNAVTSYGGCAMGSNYFDFQDPLPPGRVPVAVQVMLFTSLCSNDGVVLEVTLQELSATTPFDNNYGNLAALVLAGSELTDNLGYRDTSAQSVTCTSFSATSCSRILLEPSQFYQTGWPSWNSSGTNQIVVNMYPAEDTSTLNFNLTSIYLSLYFA